MEGFPKYTSNLFTIALKLCGYFVIFCLVRKFIVKLQIILKFYYFKKHKD